MPVAMSRLEAINIVLAGAGHLPVDSESPTHADSAMAGNALDAAHQRVMNRGWHWNTEMERVFQPRASDDRIELPANVMRVDRKQLASWTNYALRGRDLFDKENNTYEFTGNVTLDVVISLGWTELPNTARVYISALAAREFGERTIGTRSVTSATRLSEAQAWQQLMQEELSTGDYNMMDERTRVMLDRGPLII